MDPFSYSALPGRVIFGIDTLAELPVEFGELGTKRALVICTPQQVDQAASVRALLGDSVVAVFSGAAMHTPVEVTAEATKVVGRE